MPKSTLTLPRPRGFSLDAAASFYSGFIPGSGMAAAGRGCLTLAFRLDRSFEAVAVSLREEGTSLVGHYTGTGSEATLSKQLVRILGLDVDGDSWLAIGRRDPVVGALQAEFPGFFTAAKPSPYDAAVWSILAARMPMRVAAALKVAIAEKQGDALLLDGHTHHVFPSPLQVVDIERVSGLSDEKLVRLKGVAVAALDGTLDPDRLRAMEEGDALTQLQTLRGIGPWSASHILYRGAALPDALPTAEPRVLHGFAAAYGISSPSDADLERVAEQWRPFRMWVCILLARHLSQAGGWNTAGLTRERAAAGKHLARRTADAKTSPAARTR